MYRPGTLGATHLQALPAACYTPPETPTIRSQEAPSTEPVDIAHRIVEVLADRQAEDVVLLDIREVSSFGDYFVIASAVNPRQMRALVETVSRDLRNEKVHARHQEGKMDSGWVLIDYGAVIVHIFSPDQREYYALEELWRAAKQVVRIQ